MKRLLFMISVFVIFCTVNVYADTVVEESETFVGEVDNSVSGETKQEVTTVEKSYVDVVLDNPNSTDTELLRAILICVKDLDIYVQFFVSLVFSIGLVWYFVIKPLNNFLN